MVNYNVATAAHSCRLRVERASELLIFCCRSNINVEALLQMNNKDMIKQSAQIFLCWYFCIMICIFVLCNFCLNGCFYFYGKEFKASESHWLLLSIYIKKNPHSINCLLLWFTWKKGGISLCDLIVTFKLCQYSCEINTLKSVIVIIVDSVSAWTEWFS